MKTKIRKKHFLWSGLILVGVAAMLAGISTGCPGTRHKDKLREYWVIGALVGMIKPHGSAQVRMALANSPEDVTRITVTISGPGIDPPLVNEMVKVGDNWQKVINDIPAGTDRLFLGQAYDVAGVLRFQGQAAGVTITANQTTDVYILLQDLHPAPPFENAVPIIDSFVASAGQVPQSGSASFTVAAHDPNPNDTLTYTWSATGGSFSDAHSTSTIWTAPATTGDYTITVTVTDNKGSSCRRSFVVNVYVAAGSGTVTVSFNRWPVVDNITSSECCLAHGATANLTLLATDSDGDAMSFLWSSTCGTFTNPTDQNPIFTASSSAPAGNCIVTVNIADGRGGVNSGSLTLQIQAPGCTDVTTLEVGGTMADVCSSAGFASGANSTVNGNVTAVASVTLGANSTVTGNVTSGADYTSGDSSVVNGNVSAVGDVTLGANSRIIGSVHSGSGVINYGAGATVGSVIP